MRNGQRTDLTTDGRPTQAEQDYLKAIHRLGGASQRVSTNDIADLLQVRAPSVTGMLKRLKQSGWVRYQSGHGALLTKTGVTQARLIIRKHRLLELLLTRVLGLDWSEVDAEAEALEHVVSPRLEQALADCLGDPAEDPHGHPIPSRDGVLEDRNLQPLSAFQPGDCVVIREADDSDPEWLRRWETLGLVPGATVRILSVQPLDGMFELKIGKKTIHVGTSGLARLCGETVGASPAKVAA